MKPQRQRKPAGPSHKAHAKPAKVVKRSATSESGFGALYSRLDRTQPGSKESKQIADKIIDAIG